MLKMKTKTGQKENSVKNVIRTLISNLLSHAGPTAALLSHFRLVKISHSHCRGSRSDGICRSPCQEASAPPRRSNCGHVFQQDHPEKGHRQEAGTKAAISRDSWGGKSWCSMRGLQMTWGLEGGEGNYQPQPLTGNNEVSSWKAQHPTKPQYVLDLLVVSSKCLKIKHKNSRKWIKDSNAARVDDINLYYIK